jgi:hypothetical protein
LKNQKEPSTKFGKSEKKLEMSARNWGKWFSCIQKLMIKKKKHPDKWFESKYKLEKNSEIVMYKI